MFAANASSRNTPAPAAIEGISTPAVPWFVAVKVRFQYFRTEKHRVASIYDRDDDAGKVVN
jgi:hypothetical protein